MFRTRLLLPLYFLLPLFAMAATQEQIVEYLKAYEGRWVGEFSIQSTSTGYTQTFPVEQRYWWENGELKGVSASETKEGMQMANSRTFIADGKIRSIVTRGNTSEGYVGLWHEGGIMWVSDDLQRANDYQLKESFVNKSGKWSLHTDGFDTYVTQGGISYLTYRGRLVKESEQGTRSKGVRKER